MARTEFPTRARRQDPNGHMVVQTIVEYLRDQFDKFVGGFARGSATVTNGNTTVVVTHGLGASTYSAEVTPLADPGGRYWISGKSATQFTINLSAAAGVTGVPFDWLVKGA